MKIITFKAMLWLLRQKLRQDLILCEIRMLFRGAARVRMVMKDSIVGKSVPCRGLTSPNNPGSNQEPRREEVGREGT